MRGDGIEGSSHRVDEPRTKELPPGHYSTWPGMLACAGQQNLPASATLCVMNAPLDQRQLSASDMKAILGVTSALAAPFDLMTMLAEVVSAAKQVLRAERGSVWLYDAGADELVLEVATGMKAIRVPAGVGLAGTCARNRQIINVPD